MAIGPSLIRCKFYPTAVVSPLLSFPVGKRSHTSICTGCLRLSATTYVAVGGGGVQTARERAMVAEAHESERGEGDGVCSG